jgi:hypothetical protein
VAHSKARAVLDPTPSRRVHWQALLEECRGSGLSQVEFCRRRGIRPGTLAFWKHTLARETSAARSRARRARPAAPAFVPVRVIAPPHPIDDVRPGSVPAPSEIEIVLRGDRHVRLRGRVDLEWLGQVVRTLETLGC